jgi:hypothetical protein
MLDTDMYQKNIPPCAITAFSPLVTIAHKGTFPNSTANKWPLFLPLQLSETNIHVYGTLQHIYCMYGYCIRYVTAYILDVWILYTVRYIIYNGAMDTVYGTLQLIYWSYGYCIRYVTEHILEVWILYTVRYSIYAGCMDTVYGTLQHIYWMYG